MEFFSRGLELGNQVYMQYEQTSSGPRELSLKVLDMGMGQERNAWFTKGKTTSYEVTFPTVVKWLEQHTGIRTDAE
jgi:alanyl-tRNA synthetase